MAHVHAAHPFLPATCAQSFAMSSPPVTCPNLAPDFLVRVFRYLPPPEMDGRDLILVTALPGNTGIFTVTPLRSPNIAGGPWDPCE